MVGGEPEPTGGAVDDGAGVVDQGVVEAAAGGLVAVSSPSMRAPRSVPRVTIFLAPESKDVIFSLDP